MNKHREAVRILDAIICQSPEEFHNVSNYVTKIKCLLELELIDDAVKLTNQIDLILASTRNLRNLRSQSEEVISGLQDLIEGFIDVKCFDTTMLLAQCKYNVEKFYCENDNERLERFEETGGLIERLVREVMRVCGRDHCERPKEVFESVLREMLLIKGVSMEEKAVKLAWVYKYFAFYCDEIRNYHRSVELNRQGITVMKTVFGADSNKHKVFGHLYNNMGASLFKLKCFARANSAYTKALAVYNEAEDWKDQKVKYEIINQTKESIEQTKRKK